MAIRIYNSQTRTKSDFKPVHQGEVRMYVCGPTVYDFLHVGNFRGAIFYNMVRNWLEVQGYRVTYVYNYTDIDDKILNRSQELGMNPRDLANKFIDEFKKDYKSLKLRPHDHNPRVTEFIQPIIDMIQKLIDNDMAYESSGDVYFNVHHFSEYGKLSNKKIEELEEGYRIDVSDLKKHPSDFALWKSAKEGEEYWVSPWGKGRPGWHIECSAMSSTLLGETLDIHGGGLDLIFPHHENEIAQSEGCSHKPYVNYWMHNNMIEFGDKKMSKSLGNIKTGRSFIEEYNGEILKFMMLNSHYRSTIDFSEIQIERTISNLAKFYSSLAWAKELISKEAPLYPLPEKFEKLLDEVRIGFSEALNDDFNSADAISKLFELTRAFNQETRKPKFEPQHKAVAEAYSAFLKNRGNIMSLFQEPPQEFLKSLDQMLMKKKNINSQEVENLVQERTEARKQKNFTRSDEIRSQLTTMGIELRDTADGITYWEVAK